MTGLSSFGVAGIPIPAKPLGATVAVLDFSCNAARSTDGDGPAVVGKALGVRFGSAQAAVV